MNAYAHAYAYAYGHGHGHGHDSPHQQVRRCPDIAARFGAPDMKGTTPSSDLP